MPNPTTQASKLMQTRLKVSGRTCRMTRPPSGIPTARLGRMYGSKQALSEENIPATQYAVAVKVDSASRTSQSPARKACFARPWLLSITANGGPDVGVAEY